MDVLIQTETKQMKSPLDTLDRRLVELLQAKRSRFHARTEQRDRPESVSRVYEVPEVRT